MSSTWRPTSFEGFQLERILYHDPESKSMGVLGRYLVKLPVDKFMPVILLANAVHTTRLSDQVPEGSRPLHKINTQILMLHAQFQRN
jgi:hypothetical protein